MFEKIETLLILLGIIGVLAVVAERLRFPYPILLVVAGLGVACLPALPEISLDPDLVFVIFLPPLIFSAAWNFPWDEFRANLLPIFSLAVWLVFLTMLCVALVAHWLVPGLTLAAAFVLGAIVAPPDAVAATAVLKNLRIPRRLHTILEGESLVNDSSALVAYQFAVAAVVTGTFSFHKAGADFLWMSAGGILLGWVMGILVERLHRHLQDPAVEITLTIMTPYLAYLPAEKLGVSGVLAVVAAGLHIGHRSWEALSPESRLQRDAIWRFLDYLLNGMVFILIGLQIPSVIRGIEGLPIWQLGLVAVVISLVVIGVRFLWIFPMTYIEHRWILRDHGTAAAPRKGWLVVASWAGMRGVVSLATAMALPLTTHTGAVFPRRHVIIFLTFSVICATLVLQGLTLPWVVRKLKVEETDAEYESESEARVLMIEEMIREIDKEIVRQDAEADRDALRIWRGHYEDRLNRMKERFEQKPDELVLAHEQEIFPRLMEHARRYLANLRRKGKISEEVHKRIQYDFDLEEQRIRRMLGHL